MPNRVFSKQAASPSHKAEQGDAAKAGLFRTPQSILAAVLLLGLGFFSGCSGGSTPLYYKAKSGFPPPPQPDKQVVQPQAQVPAQTQALAAAQPQPQQPMPAQAQLQPQPPMAAQTQACAAYNTNARQQQLMMQTAQASSSGYRDYKVGAEDLLAVDVLGQESLKREVRVNGVGQISMPLVGVIPVAGQTTQQIEGRLREAYGSQYLRNPQISVEVKEFHHQRVAVTGAVMKPGYYDIIGPRTLLEVLSMAGGLGNKPGPEAGDVIHVIHREGPADLANTMKTASVRAFAPQTKTTVINIQRLISGQAPELNVMVENGDVVYVPFAGTAYVLGAVRKPGNVTVKENLMLTQAISMAQGIDPVYATYKVTIMRFDEQGRPVRIEADMKDITNGKEPDIPIKDNDAIVVKEGELKTRLYVIRQILPIPSGGYAIPTR